MNFQELFEGATPKLPGAVGGIKVMSMDQFLAQSGDEPEEKIDEMSSEELDKMSPEELAQFTHKARTDKLKNVDPNAVDQAYGKSMSIMFPDSDKRSKQSTNHKPQGVTEGTEVPQSVRVLQSLKNSLESYLQNGGARGGQNLKQDLIPLLNHLNREGDGELARSIMQMIRDSEIDDRRTKGISWAVFAQALVKKLPELITSRMKQDVAEAGITGSRRSADSIAKQKEWQSSSASDSTQDTKTFSYQGYTISFAPDKLNIYLGGDLVFSRKGNFANPTKKQLVAARLSIGKIIDNKRRESLVHSAVKKSKGILGVTEGEVSFHPRFNEVKKLMLTYYKSLGKDFWTWFNEPGNKEFFAKRAGVPPEVAYAIVNQTDWGQHPKNNDDDWDDWDDDWDDKKVSEATKLPAQTRELKGQELDDYLDRIRNREKGKTDKYKLPYIHRSSVVKYYNEEGKKYDTDQIKQALGTRPKKLLKQNEKMKHSNGELEQFFNIGFAALVGIALDEGTNELIVVNTCPGAGSCKIECFAMKGGKVQFEGPWLSDGRILTFLLNDPDGFFNQLSNEITKEEKLAQKGGYNLTIRWHDAGDFFSPEYQDLAFKLADAHPDVKFYAYTKIAGAALGQKPANFIVNWSEGASTSQEKQVKAQDANLDKTKNSRIVPSKLFYDLLKKDKDNKLDKTADGAWQPRDAAALEELKDRLAAAYNLKRDSIIDYNEMMATPQKNNIQKWNVIIAPGEGDISANRQDVLSTLLLKH